MFELKDALVRSIHAELTTNGKRQSFIQKRQHFLSKFWFNLFPWPRKTRLSTKDSTSHLSSQLGAKTEDKESAERSTQTALQAIGQSLAAANLELGKDFSYGQGSLIVNERALNYLQDKLGPKQFAHIMETVPGLLQTSGKPAMESLERHLGVPFFDNLQNQMLAHLPTLTDAEIICYFTHLIDSFGRRHPEIKGFEGWVKAIVHQAIPSRRLQVISQRYQQGALQIEPTDGWPLLVDLLTAAGGREGIHYQKHQDCIKATPAGLKLLDQLIIGRDSRLADLL